MTPSEFLATVLGRPVEVKLDTGVVYKGVLASLDGFMNLVLEQTEEFVNGKKTRAYGDAFLRGNNVTYISLQKGAAA
ncbi:U6 snRNA-associated Sm-like protein LSm6 [Thecamonas trahens ATCC 50062]|uniref:U6 snRNA-associated Sm-like protein LSm6 n=1 Tax=Thecamonas trahens ATCC 50062 TaxID=461836 RepID=A0A0L0DD04_THETB|nr:U6 snRNA-associated Sm-like protein LSm6 [Thecamonas trahens ATCC 50062]KNC50214.1 U6 snRNA-associated Sm-like protein LSm6 [Thecamonas trahens ATCC 50062]|eukprot:XP_013757049.1 U6 snRNA-associated Sm-like protein LSm6 [Thecamonas trahens ATCC 50062]